MYPLGKLCPQLSVSVPSVWRELLSTSEAESEHQSWSIITSFSMFYVFPFICLVDLCSLVLLDTLIFWHKWKQVKKFCFWLLDALHLSSLAFLCVIISQEPLSCNCFFSVSFSLFITCASSLFFICVQSSAQKRSCFVYLCQHTIFKDLINKKQALILLVFGDRKALRV